MFNFLLSLLFPLFLFIECRTIFEPCLIVQCKTSINIKYFPLGVTCTNFVFIGLPQLGKIRLYSWSGKSKEGFYQVREFLNPCSKSVQSKSVFLSIHTRLIILAAQSVKSQVFFCLGGWQLCCSSL